MAKLKVNAILFDLDGTIVDSRDAYVEAAKAAFHAMGLEAPSTETALQIPKRLEQNLPIDDLTHATAARFLDVYLKTFYAVTNAKTRPIRNIQHTLENLRKKARLLLITMRNSHKATVAKELKQFGLAQYFTCIMTARDMHKPKPSPEAVEEALEVVDAHNCECLIVGDSVIDIILGKAAGAKTVGVLSGLYTRQELAKLSPDLILKDATQLPDFIG